jgi:hypothetical protein
MSGVLWRSALAVPLLLGCSHARRLAAADLDQLSQLATTLESVPESALPGAALSGLSEVGLDHSPACRASLKELAASDPVERAMVAARTIDACHLSCPVSLRALASVPEEQRTAAVAAQCDAAGADPVFGGALAADRARMPLLDYIMLRFLLGDARAALDRDGSPRTRQLWARYARLIPRLIASVSSPPPVNSSTSESSTDR